MKKNKVENTRGWPTKAYKNLEFLNSPQARIIRVLTELMEPSVRFKKHRVRNTVVFFGSSRACPADVSRRKLKEIEKKIKGKRSVPAKLKKEYGQAKKDVFLSRYYEDAVRLSEKLTIWFKELEKQRNHYMVCSGGGPGIMEAANRGARKAKGESVGLNISILDEQFPNAYVTKDLAFEFHYFFIRKFWFFYLAKALVIFPGGYGTFDELFELLTLIQTKKTKKYMPIVLYDSAYWKKVVDWEEMVNWGTIQRKDLRLFRICDTVDDAFDYLKKELMGSHLQGKGGRR